METSGVLLGLSGVSLSFSCILNFEVKYYLPYYLITLSRHAHQDQIRGQLDKN